MSVVSSRHKEKLKNLSTFLRLSSISTYFFYAFTNNGSEQTQFLVQMNLTLEPTFRLLLQLVHFCDFAFRNFRTGLAEVRAKI